MTIDTSTCFTDYDWSDDHRPELRLSTSGSTYTATITIGRDAGAASVIGLEGPLNAVLCELEGYAEIFQAAVAHLRKEKLKAELTGTDVKGAEGALI